MFRRGCPCAGTPAAAAVTTAAAMHVHLLATRTSSLSDLQDPLQAQHTADSR